MNRVTGQIILTFKADTATGEELLEAEQYLNNVVDKMCYANKAFSIRVHLDQPYEGMTAEQVHNNLTKPPKSKLPIPEPEFGP